jgi:hypothetical protein
MHVETSHKNEPLKCRNSVVQRQLFTITQLGTSNSGKPPQGADISAKPRGTDHKMEGEDSCDIYAGKLPGSLFIAVTWGATELTPWSGVLPEKLSGPQLAKKFTALYGI